MKIIILSRINLTLQSLTEILILLKLAKCLKKAKEILLKNINKYSATEPASIQIITMEFSILIEIALRLIKISALICINWIKLFLNNKKSILPIKLKKILTKVFFMILKFKNFLKINENYLVLFSFFFINYLLLIKNINKTT